MCVKVIMKRFFDTKDFIAVKDGEVYGLNKKHISCNGTLYIIQIVIKILLVQFYIVFSNFRLRLM